MRTACHDGRQINATVNVLGSLAIRKSALAPNVAGVAAAWCLLSGKVNSMRVKALQGEVGRDLVKLLVYEIEKQLLMPVAAK